MTKRDTSTKIDTHLIKATPVSEKSEYEIARWGALFYGVNMIADLADDKNLDFNSIHIDQPALDKYVDEISDDVLHALQSYNKPLR